MIPFIFEKRMYRFRVLFELYKKADANLDFVAELQFLANNEGIGLRSFTTAWKYLQMEGLIRVRAASTSGSEDYRYYASITHPGIKAIEDVFINENESTYYFPAYREMMN